MAIRYDSNALRGLIDRISALKDPRLTNELSQRIGAGFTKLVADEFKESVGPDGKPWKPVQRNRKRDRLARERRARAGKPIRGDKPLIDTGRMRASVTAIQSSGSTVRIAIPVDYAGVHQNGGHVKPHTRAASYDNVTYSAKVNGKNRFLTESEAKKMIGAKVTAGRYSRAYSQGITIPRRQMLPEGELPPKWRMVAEKEANLLLAQKAGLK